MMRSWMTPGVMALAFAGSAQAAEHDAVVKAPDATYAGITTASGHQFLGIHYAMPPVGPLRWQPPRPVPASTATVVATHPGSKCVQPEDSSRFVPTPADKFVGSEDCLSLNVYTPSGGTPAKPVMVWVHGGGYMSGAGSSYDGHVLAERNDVVVVTLNYRLGALGFFSAPGLGEGSGNFGILDQQLALKWVQRNIAAFGGDPSNVTVFGESAGGNSVCTQLLSPGSRGLYARVILESAACGPRVKIYARAEADRAGTASAAAVHCTGSDALACLRRLPAYTVAAMPSTLKSLGMIPFAPIAGTLVVPKDSAAFAEGAFNRVPVLYGTNLDEGRTFALFAQKHGQVRDASDYAATVRSMFGDRSTAILQRYPATAYPSPLLAYAAVVTDALFSCPAHRFQLTASRFVPIHAYEFRDRHAPIEAAPTPEIPSYGAFHAAEMQYVFQTDLGFTNPAKLDASQRRLADQMMRDWAGFARTGTLPAGGADPWQPATPQTTNLHVLQPTEQTIDVDFDRFHQCAFWDAL